MTTMPISFCCTATSALGAYASHDFGHHLVAFAAGDNLFDRSIEAGKTPTLTLASPRVARFGLRINFGD